MKILVYSESPRVLAELIAGARELAGAQGAVEAVVAGGRDAAERAVALGANRVYVFEGAEARLADDLVPGIAKLAADAAADALLVGATVRGRAVAGRVAALLGTAAVAAAKSIEGEAGFLRATRAIFGGGAVRTEGPAEGILVATVAPGTFDAEAPDTAREGSVEVLPFVEPAARLTKLSSKPKQAASTDILSAKRVVGVGRGFATAEDLVLARQLADALGGEVGYTRPIAEGNPPLVEGEPYIGVSGISVKPDLYVAVGLSGQTQHTVGVTDSKVVVCINKDPKALMFRHSDYGIVGDLFEVLPALTEALASR